MPKPFARRATACPIRPKPTMPIVLWWTSWPSIINGPQIHGVRARRRRSPSPIRRAPANKSANAVSAVVSVNTSGVLVASTPAGGARVDVDVVEPDGVVRDDLQLRPGGGEQLRIDALGEHRDQRVATGHDPQEFIARDAELVLVHGHVASLAQTSERLIHDRAGHQHVRSTHGFAPRDRKRGACHGEACER